jgi:hypothetical protein
MPEEFKATIVFTGICLFLRPDGGGPPHWAHFMDGRQHGCDPHNLYLAVDHAKYTIHQLPVEQSLPVDCYPDKDGHLFSVVRLDGTLIEVASIVKEGLVTERDLADVPRLGDVWPKMIIGGCHKEAAELHHDKWHDKLKNRVNSRFRLRVGDLAVRYMDYQAWRFEPVVPMRPAREGYIPQEIGLQVTPLEKGLDLEIRDTVTNELKVLLQIRPKDESAHEMLVMLANVPVDDLFPKDEPDPNETDHHFTIYYKAYDDPPNDPPIPHKIKSAVRPDAFPGLERAGGANCGPAIQP